MTEMPSVVECEQQWLTRPLSVLVMHISGVYHEHMRDELPLLWRQEFGADPSRLNPRGGAIALGHALGSSGTRLLATLLNEVEARGGRYGLQTMCEGGGTANATLIEVLR